MRMTSLKSVLGNARAWEVPHLLSTFTLSKKQIQTALDVAARLKDASPEKIGKPLAGKRVLNFFVEPSTRTKVSFSLAAKGLGCETIDLSPSQSSLSKGESLIDTAKTIESMGIDYVVIRHKHSGAPHFLSRRIHATVLNAGDGWNEHPTQALLDLFTMKERLGRVTGLHVVLVGDITHSRVARSNIWALSRLDNRVTVVGPPTLIPRHLTAPGLTVTHDIESALSDADVVMMLRIQKERLGKHLFPSESEYTHLFGLTRERFENLPEKTIVMHPGPMNRGLEICSEAADSDRSVILHQVKNGIYVRMAALLLLAGKGKRK